MNVMGKILVILNVVFAVMVGGFLVVDFATRTNWKEAYDQLQGELQVARANTETLNETNQRLHDKVEELGEKLRQTRKDFVDTKKQAEDLNEKYKDAMEEAKKNVLKDVVMSEQYQGQLKLAKLENKNLLVTLDKRDKQILVLEDRADKFFKEAQTALNERDIAIARMESLQKRLRELVLEKAERDTTKTQVKGGDLIGKSLYNPPPHYVKGLVEKVDKEDPNFVQITLGSDQGIAVDHTMDVYRRSPSPKYLGQIRILQVTPHKAVARLIPDPYSSQVTLKTGDEVASRINFMK